MTYGVAESALSKMIEEWEDSLPSDIHLAYLPNQLTGVRLRLSIYGGIRESFANLVTEDKVNVVRGIFMFALPISMIVLGVVIFIRRRNA